MIWLLLVVTGLGLAIALAAHVIQAEPEGSKSWSPREIEAAKGFWAESLPSLRGSGFLVEYRTEGRCLVLSVNGDVWKQQELTLRRHLLRTASASNEILGRGACVEVRDDGSGQVYGTFKPPRPLELAE